MHYVSDKKLKISSSPETQKRFLGEESAIEKLFKNMDKNKDGKVSKLVSPKNRYSIDIFIILISFLGIHGHL